MKKIQENLVLKLFNYNLKKILIYYFIINIFLIILVFLYRMHNLYEILYFNFIYLCIIKIEINIIN